MPFSYGGDQFLLKYKSSTGRVVIDKIIYDHQKHEISNRIRSWDGPKHPVPTGNEIDIGIFGPKNGFWTEDWTSFRPFHHNGEQYYLKYKYRGGDVAIEKILFNNQNDVNDVDRIWNKKWTSGWLHVVPFDLSSGCYNLLYKGVTHLV